MLVDLEAAGAFCIGAPTGFWYYPNGGLVHNYPASYGDLNLNASRSSKIYGNSTTVQPPAVTVRYFIRAA